MNGGSWQPDPTQRHELRWWDGSEWTANVSDHGIAGFDPLPAPAPIPTNAPTSPAPTIPPPTMAAPTGPPPMAPSPAWGAPGAALGATTALPVSATPAPGARRRNLLIGAAIAGVVVLGVAGVLVLGGDDDSKGTVAAPSSVATSLPPTTVAATTTTTPATTLAPTTVPTTLPPTTAAPTTAAPATTIVAGATADVLVAAMPAGDDVPASWTQYSESQTDLPAQSGAGYGFCGGDNAAARALAAGSSAMIAGPTWDLEGGGWVGVDVFAFPTEQAATSFVAMTEQAANSCMTDPVQYDTTEAEMDLFDESVADDFVWHIAEGSGGFREDTADADELVRTVADEYVSGSLDGVDYSTTLSYLSRFERHGRVVLEFWLWGAWNDSGWSTPNPYAFQPTDEAVDAAAATIRPQIVQRLQAAGAL